eukprot:3009310-Alexandrium_andersonii.AAC.1
MKGVTAQDLLKASTLATRTQHRGSNKVRSAERLAAACGMRALRMPDLSLLTPASDTAAAGAPYKAAGRTFALTA